ncbi:MAG TPA: hypothetical protein VEL76_03175 [Gemmataceae bacterium]|nr:hypothetical protein [Gemmataceae bacterium]
MGETEGPERLMDAKVLLRVVALRKSRLVAAEFRRRPKEKGLSLFASVAKPDQAAIIEAVRAAGKQGELAAALLPASALRALGLVLTPTEGGTSSPEVNAIHYEARLGFFRRLWLCLRGVSIHNYFNEHFSAKLAELAQLLETEA